VLQPDASQAVALAAAAAILLARAPAPLVLRAGLAAAFAAAALIAWLRPDPLQPVAEVEDIFGLALQATPGFAALGAASLAAAAAAPLSLARAGSSGRSAALALCAYFAVAALAPLAGAYPVPLVGLGMSFPVGWWLGVALLAGAGKEAESG
jgi:hypothetical protein